MQDGAKALMVDLGLKVPKKVPDGFENMIRDIVPDLNYSSKNMSAFYDCYFTNESLDNIAKKYLYTPKYLKNLKKDICGKIKLSEKFAKYRTSEKGSFYSKEYVRGFDEGYKTGHEDAYDDGYTIGRNEGYQIGYQDGLQAALKCNFDLESIIAAVFPDDEVSAEPTILIEEAGFSARLSNALQRAGYSYIEEVIGAGSEKIRSIRGIGGTAYAELVDALVMKYGEDPTKWII